MGKILNHERFSWCAFDWAASAFSTNVNTFILSAYFSQVIAPNIIIGTSLWGYATALAALFVALVCPFFGSLMDHKNNLRPWFINLNLITIATIFSWWWVQPGAYGVALALSLCVISNACFETGWVLYNGLLKSIAPKSHIGRLSAWGYALGYAGGIVCLLLVLFVLIKNPFNIAFLTKHHRGVRAVGPLTAVWFLLFALPLFSSLKRPQKPTQSKSNFNWANAWSDIVLTFKHARKQKTFFSFLIARLFFIDGLNTIFAFAGIYAAGSFGMSTQDILYFAISSQLFALIGAWSFAQLDDKFGSLLPLRISLVVLLMMIVGLILAHNQLYFWIFGMILSVTVGPIQACSRAYMIRISPANTINKNFGFFTFSGKISAFLGPWLVAMATGLAGSQRAGLVPVLALVAIGFILLMRLSPPISREP